MQVNQVYDILNTITQEMLGDSIVVQEDLSNVVDIGRAFENLDNGLERYVKSLQDHIGRVVFVNRVYNGRIPELIRDGWEYGSILEKIRAKLPEATENESWNLEDGASYDPNLFYAPEVSASFWNSKVTYEVPISVTDMQVKSSFSNATQLNAFFSMIETAIQNSMTIKNDALIMRTVNALMGETIHSDYANNDDYDQGTGVRAINLLYKYNTEVIGEGGTQITVADALHDPDFIRYASLQIGLYADRLSVMNTLFNVEGTEKFTPRDKMHIVMLSEFKRAADVYLQSDTFHDEFTRLPDATSIPFWQGSGASYDFDDTSKIDIVTPSGDAVELSGILCAMFDHDAAGVANFNPRVTTNYNPKAEFTNMWHKMDAGFYCDRAEQAIVMFIA